MIRKNALNWAVIICWTIVFFFFLTIVTRFLTRQVLVERLGWDNAFTHAVFLGHEESTAVRPPAKIDWSEQYPFQGGEGVAKSRDSIAGGDHIRYLNNAAVIVKSKVRSYTTDMLLGQIALTEVARTYNRIIGFPLIQADSVIILNNGYLTYKEELIDDGHIDEIADSVKNFSDFLSGMDIGFVYVNAGSKVCPYDKQLPTGAIEHSNENGDELLQALTSRNVPVIDLREEMMKAGLDWYDSYYKTDHHFTSLTGLWAAGVLARYLNDECSFAFDDEVFDPAQYQIDHFENNMLGSQGRTVTLANCELDDYDRVLPKFDTFFYLKIPTRDIAEEGSYSEVLFDTEFFDQIADYSESDFLTKPGGFGAIKLGNYDLAIIENLASNHNANKKILMLEDSFGLYLTSFLAADVAEIDTIYLGDPGEGQGFNGSVRAYIEQTQPDVVVRLYGEMNIRPIDWATHDSLFDLR